MQAIGEHTSANSQARADWGENRGVAAIENGPAECGQRGVRVRWQCHQRIGKVLPRVNREWSALPRGQPWGN